MRITTLEKIIDERSKTMNELQSELDMAQKTNKQFEDLIDERDQILQNYESKFTELQGVL
jgi:hypothetical protein